MEQNGLNILLIQSFVAAFVLLIIYFHKKNKPSLKESKRTVIKKGRDKRLADLKKEMEDSADKMFQKLSEELKIVKQLENMGKEEVISKIGRPVATYGYDDDLSKLKDAPISSDLYSKVKNISDHYSKVRPYEFCIFKDNQWEYCIPFKKGTAVLVQVYKKN